MATWFFIGLGFALAPIRRALRRAREWAPDRRGALGAAIAAVVIALVVALAYGAALNGPSNLNDDAAAYLYLAERLLRTGGLIDPFNFRHITSYDSAELFQAMFLKAAGSGAGLATEWFLFGLLTAALFVGRMGRRYAAPGLLVAGTIVAVVHPVGATVNVAPAFSGVALTLALLRLLVVPADEHDVRRYALVGLLLGALLSLRYAFAIPVVVVVLITPSVVCGVRVALHRIAVAALIAILSVLGWAVALAKSSGTPLYPIIAGNATSPGQWRNPSIDSIGAYLGRVGHEIATDGWGIEIALALVATAIVALAARHRRSGNVCVEVVVLTSAIVGCGTLLGVTTYALSGGSYAGVGRYNAPSALAVLLCGIDLLWRDKEMTRATLRSSIRAVTRTRVSVRAVVAVAAVATVTIVTPPPANAADPPPKALPRVVDEAGTDLAVAERAIVNGTGFPNVWSPFQVDYAEINRVIPRGARVLAAVNVPGLLDFNRFSFATLDEVGAASPPPHVPLDSGPAALVSYLERLGYSGIVASVTQSPGLYSYAGWHDDLSSGIYDFRLEAQQFAAWSSMLTELSHDRDLHVARAPTLIYYGFGSVGATASS